ncbi:MAG: xylose isomerase domain-containing protein [Comamonadaceae bacterium]|nr:MAG: xylose isomerase domain-containing protein [Comamonadaceae bacterium]
MNSANIFDFALESSSLAGSLPSKLSAAQAAGFAQITLCPADLVHHPEGVDAAIAAVRASGLQVCGFHAALNFEGLHGPAHAYKLDVAKTVLSLCQALNCHLLVLPSSMLDGDPQHIATQLRQLAMLAIPLNIKLAYQGQAQGAAVKNYLQAWDLVCEADMPNLGLCLDSFEVLLAATDRAELLEDLDMLDPDRLFLVRLADTLEVADSRWRVFPGEGSQSELLAASINALHALGYRGNYSLAAANSDQALLPAPQLAERAQRAAVWVGRDVLQRSVPLPNQLRLRRSGGH